MGKWFLICGSVLLLLAGCEEAPATQSQGRAVPVTVVQVQPESFTEAVQLPGRVEPMRVAEIRARVAGVVLTQHFQAGSDISAGQLLFTIDPAPLQASLSRAEAALAQAEAQLFDAKLRLQRYQTLIKHASISQQQLDSAEVARRSADAALQAAKADVQTAKLNLGYASVRSPIAGRIGRALVTEGALVGEGETTLMAKVQQLDPIYVDFTQTAAAQPADAASRQPTLQLQLESGEPLANGQLLFTDSTVDPTTGQRLLRGQFANPQHRLLPGMYVRVRLAEAQQQALFVPQRAVQFMAGSPGVWYVTADGTAQYQPVTLGKMVQQRWQITAGIGAGTQVITGGFGLLQPGAPVQIAADAATARH